MSTYLQPTIYGKEALQLQWLNNIHHSHGLFCGCEKPFEHLQEILNKRGHQLCLPGPTTEEDGDNQHGDAADNVLDGELEDLFKEDFGEDDG